MERGFARTVEAFGGIDVLVSNAGIQIVDPLDQFAFADWKKLLAIHLDGAFLTTRAALRLMYRQGRGGSIIYMGSVHSKEASVLKAPYVTAKHGLGRPRVRANVICPGFVRTPLVDRQIPEQAKELGISEDEVIKNVMLKDTVDGEFTTVDDVGALLRRVRHQRAHRPGAGGEPRLVHAMRSASLRRTGGAAKTLKLPAEAARDYATVALVLQGGGALGAYQAGVYQALHDAGIRPNWIAGISIGAINAALIAGNPPERRVERLQAFWDGVSSSAVLPLPRTLMEYTSRFSPGDPTLRSLANMNSALRAMVEGQQGFFTPRVPSPWLQPAGSEGAMSFYDNSPLRATLAELIDFDLLNSAAVRISLGAVDVASSNLSYFDNTTTALRPEHVMASGASPPGFPAIEIDGHAY